jgi:hypothetical protein
MTDTDAAPKHPAPATILERLHAAQAQLNKPVHDINDRINALSTAVHTMFSILVEAHAPPAKE